MDLRKAKPSDNFEDRTGDDWSEALDHNWLMGLAALHNQGIDPNEALRGLTPQEVTGVLFKKALEEFGGGYGNVFPQVNHYPQGAGPLKRYK